MGSADISTYWIQDETVVGVERFGRMLCSVGEVA